MKTILLNRFWQDAVQTLGSCTVLDDTCLPVFSSLALELGWQDNKKNISCIPPGEYVVKKEYSSRFKTELWEIYGVPDRSECKFHAANYYSQLNGCVALGLKLKKMNNDQYMDITNSKDTLELFHKAFGNDKEAKLIIQDVTIN